MLPARMDYLLEKQRFGAKFIRLAARLYPPSSAASPANPTLSSQLRKPLE
jgi:hypothetical protein